MSHIVIYEQEGRAVEVQLDGDTLWLPQRQMSEILSASSPSINIHINKIYEDAELEEKATTKDSLIVQTEGKREVCA